MIMAVRLLRSENDKFNIDIILYKGTVARGLNFPFFFSGKTRASNWKRNIESTSEIFVCISSEVSISTSADGYY